MTSPLLHHGGCNGPLGKVSHRRVLHCVLEHGSRNPVEISTRNPTVCLRILHCSWIMKFRPVLVEVSCCLLCCGSSLCCFDFVSFFVVCGVVLLVLCILWLCVGCESRCVLSRCAWFVDCVVVCCAVLLVSVVFCVGLLCCVDPMFEVCCFVLSISWVGLRGCLPRCFRGC